MLHRLIYTSEVAAPMSPEMLDALLARARAANARRDVTGALVFDSHHFLQLLEGSAVQLSALYGALVRDERHRALRLVAFGPVGQRQFDDWSMAFVAADARTGRVLRRYTGSGRLDPDGLTGPAAVNILRELITPLLDAK